LYQGSKRHYKAVIESGEDFPLVLSASRHAERQLINRFGLTRISRVSRSAILNN